MATLQVGLNDPFRTIRSAISAAASGDTILLDPGRFNITSLTTPAANGAAPATFSKFGAKALSVVGAGKALTTVVGNARIYVGQLDRSGGVPLDLNLSNFRLQYELASGYILQYGDYIFNSLGYDQGGNLYYGAVNAIVGLSLDGGGGRDTLVGGSGADSFVFDAYLSAATNIDTITDFNPSEDRIVLDRAIFTTLNKGGSLSSSAFRAAAGLVSAAAAADRILYDTTSGALRYDADGSGSVNSAVQFATLASAPLASAPSLFASAIHLVGIDPVATTTEAKPTLSVGTKLNITVVPTAADTTSTAWNWVSAASDAVATDSVKLDNRSGPTVSARFYGMLGSALYEAWQVFDSEAKSSIASPSSAERWDRVVEQQIKAFFQGIDEEFEFKGGSTIGSGDDEGHDDNHPLSPTAAKLIESVVARTTFAVLSSPLSGIQAGSAGLARLEEINSPSPTQKATPSSSTRHCCS